MMRFTAPFLLALVAGSAGAQTDFYNTDRGRPLTTEDAIVVERGAFELQAAPVRFSRVQRGVNAIGVAPEFAWGFLPRTQVELGFPLSITDDAARPATQVGLEGVELELLHQLNAETMGLPSFALGAGVHLPVGSLAARRGVAVVRAIATRTLPWGRLHLNGNWTPGALFADAARGADEFDRWTAGLAVDHTFPLRSMLIGAEITTATALVDGAEQEWRTAVGVRQQLTPRLVIDAGLGRRLSAGAPGWSLTFGTAYAFARPRSLGGAR